MGLPRLGIDKGALLPAGLPLQLQPHDGTRTISVFTYICNVDSVKVSGASSCGGKNCSKKHAHADTCMKLVEWVF